MRDASGAYLPAGNERTVTGGRVSIVITMASRLDQSFADGESHEFAAVVDV